MTKLHFPNNNNNNNGDNSGLGCVELLEIRPVRPNQDVILPGMVLRGHRVRITNRDCANYRSRPGFAQSDGITQFSGPKGCQHQKLKIPLPVTSNYDLDPRRPRTSDVYDDLRASKLDHLTLLDSASPGRISNSAHDPTRYVAPPLPPPLLPNDGRTYFDFGRGRKGGGRSNNNFSRSTPSDVRRMVNEARLVAALRSTFHSDRPFRKKRIHAFGSTLYDDDADSTLSPPFTIRYQNYMSPGQDEGSSLFSNNSCRTAASKQIHRQLSSSTAGDSYQQQLMASTPSTSKEFFACSGAELSRLLDKETPSAVSTRPNSRASLISSYNFLFERHLQKLATSDEGSLQINMVGEENTHKTTSSTKKEEEEEELDELGSELVKQSLKEVAEEIAQSKSKMSSPKKVTFVDGEEDDCNDNEEDKDKDEENKTDDDNDDNEPITNGINGDIDHKDIENGEENENSEADKS